MNTAPNLWQLSFLKKYYQAVCNGEMISELACERLTGAYDYLTDRPEMQAAMKEYNRIELDEDTVFYVDHFEVKYYEGIKEAEPYFEWRSIDISGMLLRK